MSFLKGFVQNIAQKAETPRQVVQGIAEDVAGKTADPYPTPTAEKPDGWGGWKWDGKTGVWSDAHDIAGHQLWKAEQTNANFAERAPTLDTFREAGFSDASLDLYRAERAAALADQRKTLEFALGLEAPKELTPEEKNALEQRFAERALLSANSVAANARGGAGAVAAARMGVGQQMPQIAGEASMQARQAADQEFGNRVAAFNARVGQAKEAGAIGANIGQTSLGQFGQESQQQGQVLRMAEDVAGLQLDYTKLDVGTQMQILDGWLKKYGIDEQTAAQLRIAAQQNEKGPLDYITQIAGIATSVAAPIPGLVSAFGGNKQVRPLDTNNPYG